MKLKYVNIFSALILWCNFAVAAATSVVLREKNEGASLSSGLNSSSRPALMDDDSISSALKKTKTEGKAVSAGFSMSLGEGEGEKESVLDDDVKSEEGDRKIEAKSSSTIATPSYPCTVSVLDCGQGNSVVAKYDNQSMVFDAGRTVFTHLVKFEDDRIADSHFNPIYSLRGFRDKGGAEPLRYSFIGLKKVLHEIKGGFERSKDVYKDNFIREFKKRVEGDLRAVFLSHPDEDHYNLVHALDLKPRIFVLGGNGSSYYEGPGSYKKKFEAHIKAHLGNGRIAVSLSGENYSNESSAKQLEKYNKEIQGSLFEGGATPPKVRILGINASERTGADKDKNIDSMVIRVTQNHSMLIPGDAEMDTWQDVRRRAESQRSYFDKILFMKLPLELRRDLTRRYGNGVLLDKIMEYTIEGLAADVLLVSHHGSMTNGSTSLEILAQIKPKICCISAGFQHHHPTYKAIKILLDYYKDTPYRTMPHYVTYYRGAQQESIITNAPIFSTIDNGTLTVNLQSLTVTTARTFELFPSFHWAATREERTFILVPTLTPDKRFVEATSLNEGRFKKLPEAAFNILEKAKSEFASMPEGDERRIPISKVVNFVKDIYYDSKDHNQTLFYRLGNTYLELILTEAEESYDSNNTANYTNNGLVSNLLYWLKHNGLKEGLIGMDFTYAQEALRLQEGEALPSSPSDDKNVVATVQFVRSIGS